VAGTLCSTPARAQDLTKLGLDPPGAGDGAPQLKSHGVMRLLRLMRWKLRDNFLGESVDR
jgi:hypothetical protein